MKNLDHIASAIAEAMSVHRWREQRRPPSPLDRLPPRWGGRPSPSTASAAGPLAARARYALVAVACLGLTCVLALPVAAQTLSDDVTLSALVVNDGSADLPLEPTFNSATASFGEYYVDVSHDVEEVTVTATPNHSGATVEYDPPNVLPLEVGYQGIRIYVTSEDGVEDETYKVGVFRAPPATPSCTLNPGDIWCSLLPVTLNDPALLGASIGALSDFDFTYKGYKYWFRSIRLDDRDGELRVIFYPLYPFNRLTERAAVGALDKLYLQVENESFRFSENERPSWSTAHHPWSDSGLEWSEGTTVTVRLRENPPEVESVEETSWPQSGGHVYRWGDTILFTLTFSGKVRVEGQPTLVFDLGGSDREARFWGLSDIDYTKDGPRPRPRPEAVKVHFGYTVQPGDFDSDGVEVGELSSAIRLGDARILSAANGDEVELSYAALGRLMDHTVDGGSTQPPADAGVTIVDTDGNPLAQVNGEYRLVIPENTLGRYGLKLNTRPTHPVDFSAIYGDGDEDLRVLPTYTPLSIAPDEWETTYWMEIRAWRDDDAVDGERVFHNRVHSKDPVYNDLILPDVLVVEDDDDATASATALEESSGEDDLGTSAGHSEPQEEDEITALTASFEDEPSGHDGESAFTLRIAFSEAVAIDAPSVGVINGSVTEVRRVDGRDDLWEITVVPASNEMVFVSLLQPLACGETGAICTADGRPLSVGISTVVPGPEELSGTSEEQVSEELSDDSGAEETAQQPKSDDSSGNRKSTDGNAPRGTATSTAGGDSSDASESEEQQESPNTEEPSTPTVESEESSDDPGGGGTSEEQASEESSDDPGGGGTSEEQVSEESSDDPGGGGTSEEQVSEESSGDSGGEETAQQPKSEESSDDSGGEETSKQAESEESSDDSGGGEPSEEQVSEESSGDPGDEEPPTPTVELDGISASHSSVSENDGPVTITVTVTLDKAAAVDETITLAIVSPTLGKTAKQGEDFDATLDGTITIAKGQRTGTAQLILTPKDNATADGPRAFAVLATSSSGHQALINIRIDDDDEADGEADDEMADGEADDEMADDEADDSGMADEADGELADDDDGEADDGMADGEDDKADDDDGEADDEMADGEDGEADGEDDEADDEMALAFAGAVADQAYTAGAAITALQLPEAMGGEGDITYRVFDLPAGLTFDADTRTISGTPEAATAGAVEVTYLAQDSAGAGATLTFSITVNPELRLGLGDS